MGVLQPGLPMLSVFPKDWIVFNLKDCLFTIHIYLGHCSIKTPLEKIVRINKVPHSPEATCGSEKQTGRILSLLMLEVTGYDSLLFPHSVNKNLSSAVNGL